MKTATKNLADTVTMLGDRLVWALIQVQARAYLPVQRREERGVIMVEFVLLTAAIAIPVAVAFVSLGMPLLRYFRYAQMALVGPLP